MKNAYYFLVLLALAACQPKEESSKSKIEKVSSEYQTPYFEDTARVSKILKLTSVIDTIFARSAQANHNPSIAYGIVVDNKLIYANSVGYSNLEKKIVTNHKSRFRIASMTKSFTAMAILKLRDDGKLQLTDAAAKYIQK